MYWSFYIFIKEYSERHESQLMHLKWNHTEMSYLYRVNSQSEFLFQNTKSWKKETTFDRCWGGDWGRKTRQLSSFLDCKLFAVIIYVLCTFRLTKEEFKKTPFCINAALNQSINRMEFNFSSEKRIASFAASVVCLLLSENVS